MITLLCVTMIFIGCIAVLFAEKTIGLLSINNVHKLNIQGCAKILKNIVVNIIVNKAIYYDKYNNIFKLVVPLVKRWVGSFIQTVCRYSHYVFAQDKAIESAESWVILDLFRASWMDYCLLGDRCRPKAIHGIKGFPTL